MRVDLFLDNLSDYLLALLVAAVESVDALLRGLSPSRWIALDNDFGSCIDLGSEGEALLVCPLLARLKSVLLLLLQEGLLPLMKLLHVAAEHI